MRTYIHLHEAIVSYELEIVSTVIYLDIGRGETHIVTVSNRF